ncbi:MAG: type II toxin-antitoxin system VapC family toxin [Planctomycetes bacterium]|nr:type II toxin-antitoxin system VapC family toxin [Planctomycetota bacterium]
MFRATEIGSTAWSGSHDCFYVALAEREECKFVTVEEELLINVQKDFPFTVHLGAISMAGLDVHEASRETAPERSLPLAKCNESRDFFRNRHRISAAGARYRKMFGATTVGNATSHHLLSTYREQIGRGPQQVEHDRLSQEPDVAIRKQDYYEGSAQYRLLRAGAAGTIRLKSPFFCR